MDVFRKLRIKLSYHSTTVTHMCPSRLEFLQIHHEFFLTLRAVWPQFKIKLGILKHTDHVDLPLLPLQLDNDHNVAISVPFVPLFTLAAITTG